MKIFYTYLWLREDGTPYYVGKGTGDRAYSQRNKHFPPPDCKDKIIVQEWPSEEDSFKAEIFLIEYYGRVNSGTGILRNLTDGGEGPSGMQVSDKTKKLLSLQRIGNKYRLGIPHTEETKKKISAAIKGVSFTEEHKKRIAESLKGKKKSPEHIAAMKSQRQSPEYRMKMSIACRTRTDIQ